MCIRDSSRSAQEMLRPAELEQIIGQSEAIAALVSKLASPYPPHIILYGPPGVGKTTAARLALKSVQKIPGAIFSEKAPFVEVDGATLRWDPREIADPLIGSVHDPIYQGARRNPVSYTHLDVYKRQGSASVPQIMVRGSDSCFRYAPTSGPRESPVERSEPMQTTRRCLF